LVLVGRLALVLALLIAPAIGLGACRPVGSIASPSPSALTPEQAATLIRETVVGAKPLLVLIGVPSDWRAEVTVSSASFSATYRSGGKRITLAIAAANPPLPGEHTVQSSPTFHGDARALYQIADRRDPASERWLLWVEAGTWSQPGPGGIPYMLSSAGVTEAEFWTFAGSLHPNQI
jgi:hypothetical protein